MNVASKTEETSLTAGPLSSGFIVDRWAAYYHLDHDSYRLSVGNSQSNQGEWWPIPHRVITNVLHLLKAQPNRVELQGNPGGGIGKNLLFTFDCPVPDHTLKSIQVNLSLPQGAFTVHAIMVGGGGYDNASAGDGSIDAFLALLELSRSKPLQVGYDGQERRINFNLT